jgi:hypothetical protein
MATSLHALPPDPPVPAADGACDHLPGEAGGEVRPA